MLSKSMKSLEFESNLKRLENLLAKIRQGFIFVEGQKDRKALARIGCNGKMIFTISGNLRISASAVADKTRQVIVLTDLDQRGNQLAIMAREELERYSIIAETETRKELGALLGLKHFEQIEQKLTEFLKGE